MTITRKQIDAGQAVYTPRTLKVYDFIVLGISNHFIWKCPTRRLKMLYDRHMSRDHLDVGVGTGYFLDKYQYPEQELRIALMDINEHSLQFTAKRLARFNPTTYCHNAFDPIDSISRKFDSIGINYLLHCLPGNLSTKGCIFDNLKEVMRPNAVLFGSTLLHSGVNRNFLAKCLMDVYNRRGIFHNQLDSLEGLRHELLARFDDVSIETCGSAALFAAKN